MHFSFITTVSALLIALTVVGVIEASLREGAGTLYAALAYSACVCCALLLYAGLRRRRRPQPSGEEYECTVGTREFTGAQITATALVGAAVLSRFVLENVSEHSVAALAVFSEEYRNSIYKGSGIHTAVVIHVLPLMLAFNITFGRRLSVPFYFGLLVQLLSVMTLGLRVLLAPLLLALLLRVARKRAAPANVAVAGLLALSLSVSLKMYIEQATGSERSVQEHILNPLTRLRLPYLIHYEFGHGINTAVCAIPALHFAYECGAEEIKHQLVMNNDQIHDGFANLSKYSGLAIPLPVYLYNMFGFASIPMLVAFLLALRALSDELLVKNHRRWIRMLALGIVLNMSAALLEDYLFIRRIDVTAVTGILLVAISLPSTRTGEHRGEVAGAPRASRAAS